MTANPNPNIGNPAKAVSPKKFVWYDVMTSDVAAAADFYRSVVGWSAADSGSERTYLLLSAGPDMVGGIMPIPEEVRPSGARPVWFGYIGVDDVDAYAGRVVEAGGKVHRGPHDIPGVGRFAVAADPHGATFILFTPNRGEERAQVAAGTPGHVGWRELYGAISKARGHFILSFSAGRKQKLSTRGRWASTRPLQQVTNPWAV